MSSKGTKAEKAVDTGHRHLSGVVKGDSFTATFANTDNNYTSNVTLSHMTPFRAVVKGDLSHNCNT